MQKAKYEIQILSEILTLQDKIKEHEKNNKVEEKESSDVHEKPKKTNKKKPV